jgi:hypothetical protein
LPASLVGQVLEKRQAVKNVLKWNCFCSMGVFGIKRRRERSHRHKESGGRRCGNDHGVAYAGSRPLRAASIISALARASVDNSAFTDLVPATSAGAGMTLIANAEQSYTIFSLARFGCVLAA